MSNGDAGSHIRLCRFAMGVFVLSKSPPLIALPGTSPRIVTGEVGRPQPRHPSYNADDWRTHR
ncbi:hypothetical protein MESS2_1110007 [Mesorhizobium metallidurans STM 2683]|uniref:Uncharacterized protein n=1 Tax=Mesorhizobium metallidurans STM 2683 TaxID=1297569 RepID=M5EHZ7_9HYPH|nr:hypothetical protein MESS2_1110007 [Mesorhizobium metallidurans STM 2683]